MKKYFEFLGLQEGADKNQVQEAYERLSKEISTNSTKGIHEIQSEYNNIQEAYRELMKEFNKTDKNSIDYYTSKSIEKPIIKNKNRSFMRNFSTKDIVFFVTLLFMATGIWGIFLQNMGYFRSDKNTTKEGDVQLVEVVNTVNANIQNEEISVNGNVEVDNTVSVSIDEVLGSDNKKYYFK